MGDTVVPNTSSEPPAKAFDGAAYCGGAISADGRSIGRGYYRELKGINPPRIGVSGEEIMCALFRAGIPALPFIDIERVSPEAPLLRVRRSKRAKHRRRPRRRERDFELRDK